MTSLHDTSEEVDLSILSFSLCMVSSPRTLCGRDWDTRKEDNMDVIEETWDKTMDVNNAVSIKQLL